MRSKPALALIALSSLALVGTASPAGLPAKSFTVVLSGEAEVNDPTAPEGGADLDGSGLVRLTLDPAGRQICYDFAVSGLATPLMAHIHRAHALHNGPSVVTLFTGPGGELKDCVMWTEERLAEIVADPSSFYVNLYTTEFPDGALRGQLAG